MKWQRPQRWGPWLGILFLTCLILLALQWKIEIHWGAPSVALESEEPPARAPSAEQEGLQTEEPTPTTQNLKSPRDLLQKIQLEAQRIGQITHDPMQTERDLDNWAQSLSDKDLLDLKKVLFSRGIHSGDELALALDLLGRKSQSVPAAEILMDYVLQSPNESGSREIEVLQLLALDGLIDHSLSSGDSSFLRRVQSETTDSLLARRAAQALSALTGQSSSPRESDEAALKSLLGAGR